MRLLVKLYFKYLKLTKKRTIKIPSWIKDIPSGTFNNLPELEEVVFNGEINDIQRNAFSCCPSLKTIRFNKKVDNIDSQAFDDISEVTFCFSKEISSEDIKKMRQILRKEKSNPADEGFETENATESLVETTAADDLSDTLNKSDSAFITEEDETVSATTSFEDTIVSTADEVVLECVTEENDNSYVPDTMETIEAATGDEVITDYEEEKEIVSVLDASEAPITDTVDEAAPELLKEDIELTPAQEVSEDVTIAGDIDNEIDSALDEKEYISDISPEVATDDVDEADDITISEENVTELEMASVAEKAVDITVAESEDEFVEKQPVVDTFEEIVLEVKKGKEKPAKTAKRSRVLSNESKEDLRKSDRTKYSNCNSLTDIKTTDKLVEKLIERYSMLENKYSHDFPLGLIDVSKDEFNALASLRMQLRDCCTI